MYRYAEIDETTGICFAVSILSGEVDQPSMVPLNDDDDVIPSDIYANGEWTRPEQTPPVEPQPSPEQIEITDLRHRTEDLEILLADIITGGM